MIQLSYSISSISPIVTGDYNSQNKELQASGLLGSLRYQYWLLKAMQAWQADPKKPLYPRFKEDHLPARTGPNDTAFRAALAAAGPVVWLFGATNWKKMFRLEIAEAEKSAEQACSARSDWKGHPDIEPWQWTFKLIFRQDRTSPILAELTEQNGMSLANELHSLMAFVHQYGWLGAASQNGLGWVRVECENAAGERHKIEKTGCIIPPPANPVFAAKDVLFSRQEAERLLAELIAYYQDKSSKPAPDWKLGRYRHSVHYLRQNPPPVGYEIRRWLRDQMFPPAQYEAYQEKYFGNQKHAGFVHVTHPDVQSDGSWRVRLRFAVRPDKVSDTTRLYPAHVDLAPQNWLDSCEKFLNQDKPS